MAIENWKKQRRIGNIPTFTKKFYIFCEGRKTEPNYFEGMKRRIEQKGIYKNSVFVNIEGVGKGTLKILDYAKKYIEKNKVEEGEAWIVYDKDDFTERDFNLVSSKINTWNQTGKKIEYHAAWSNQCIEYWFILHFDYYTSDNDRFFYVEYLNKKFFGLGAGLYAKNDKNIFEKLERYGNSDKAVKFAEKRLEELAGLPDAKAVPATKVHLLYTKLRQYFE